MDSKIAQNPRVSRRHKELADRLRGDMSYSQHYAYLLDWFMNDKNDWRVDGFADKAKPYKTNFNVPTRQPNGKARSKIPEPVTGIPDTHIKDTMKDVLESLKHLEKRIDKVSAGRTGIEAETADAGIKVGRTERHGNIFTRLVDPRRYRKK